MAETPETSDYTSIQERLGRLPAAVPSPSAEQSDLPAEPAQEPLPQAPLMPFDATGRSAVGAPARLTDLCAQRQTRFLHGMRAARKVFGHRERVVAYDAIHP